MTSKTSTPRPTGRDAVTPAAVELTGLVKRFGAVTAVDRLDLCIRRGEVVALLGPNGAGKSTTIEMLLGLTRPDAGRVGAMPQSGGLLPDLTVQEIVTLAGALYPRRHAVRAVLDRAGITEFAGQLIGGLSGGQQQRVRFAMALVADPELIVLDEPTTGLDVEARRAFWATMREETARGRTVLFATHYLDEADAYADRIVFMRSGRIVADGSANQIKALAAGRTIRVTLPEADPGRLAALPGVEHAELRGSSVLLRCTDSDTALRELLRTTDARDVEVTGHGLEAAFITLTTKGAAR